MCADLSTWLQRGAVPAALLTSCLVIGATARSGASEVRLDEIRLPSGFAIEVFAEGVENARSMTQSDDGIVYVGSRRKGAVYAVVDRDADGRADEVHTLLTDLFMPSGVTWHQGSLYVAEVHRILRLDDIDTRLEDPPEPVVIRDDLPDKRHHGWKFIAFGPDGKLYVPVGAPCNVCSEGDPFATILRMNPDGSDREVFARGVRNTVGFDWHPETGELWFTDNGRDMMGDDVPADELNRAPRAGLHFGFPACHDGTIPDPEFGGEMDCADTVPPAQSLDPHVAAIGMRFYEGDAFPEAYRGQIFIAEHGSWNRTEPIGYRIVVVHLNEGGEPVEYEKFATGWLQDGKFWGRPADVLVRPDGSLLVSDDLRGVIYRISYSGDS